MTRHTRSPPMPSARDSLDPGPTPQESPIPMTGHAAIQTTTIESEEKPSSTPTNVMYLRVLLSSPPRSTAPTRKAGDPSTGPELFPWKVAKGQRNSHETMAKLVSRNGSCRTVPIITYTIPGTVPQGKPPVFHSRSLNMETDPLLLKEQNNRGWHLKLRKLTSR